MVQCGQSLLRLSLLGLHLQADCQTYCRNTPDNAAVPPEDVQQLLETLQINPVRSPCSNPVRLGKSQLCQLDGWEHSAFVWRLCVAAFGVS